MDEQTPIPLAEYVGAPEMPWLFQQVTDPAVVVWPDGQHVRIMWPSRCTNCGKGHREGDPPLPVLAGLVSVHEHAQWIHYCPDHYGRRP